jgi:protein TonB
MSGAVTAAALTLATGYGVIVAANRSFVPPVEKITQLFIMEPEKLQQVKPIPVEAPKEVKIEKPPELVAPPIVPPPQVEPVIVAPPAPAEPAPAPVSPLASGNDRSPPKLLTTTKPDYPLQSVRAEEQGTTHLAICVTEAGRVQSVTIAQSSGHPRLDAAAASWMRSARFRPGSVGGVPQAMCGHDVYYDWNLKDVGRT